MHMPHGTALQAPEIGLLHDPAALSPLEEGWGGLGAALDGPTGTHAWTAACLETLHREDQPYLAVLGPPEAPSALAPLVARPGPTVRLEMIGVDALREPTDLLYESPEALEALCVGLADLEVPIEFGRLPDDSPAVAALERAFRGRGLVRRNQALSCPTLRLDERWRTFGGGLSSRRRSDLRRMQRKAETHGPVTHEVCSPSLDALPPLLEAALTVEDRSWKGRQGTALLQDDTRGAFFRRYAEATARAGTLRLAFLRIDDRVVAMQLAVEQARRLWLLKIGYDEDYAACSPGNLLLGHTVCWAAERGLDSVEFLGAPAPWTRVWTADERAMSTLRAYPTHVRTVAALGAEAIDRARKRFEALRSRS